MSRAVTYFLTVLFVLSIGEYQISCASIPPWITDHKKALTAGCGLTLGLLDIYRLYRKNPASFNHRFANALRTVPLHPRRYPSFAAILGSTGTLLAAEAASDCGLFQARHMRIIANPQTIKDRPGRKLPWYFRM